MWKQAATTAGAPEQAERAAPERTPGKRTLTEATAASQSQTAGNGDAVHVAAQRGVATAGTPLPFGASIQQLFGRHDVSGIQAHTGPEATASARAMGASAYATGNHVVLGDGADLHTVAHEAAHVVQQRAGVQLKGGVGEHGDPHEQHANAVADRVVRGASAESLLDRYAAGSAASATVQRKWVGERVVEDEPQRRWEQEDGELEQRPDGWYRQTQAGWVAVAEAEAPTRKRDRNRWDEEEPGQPSTASSSKVKDKAPAEDRSASSRGQQKSPARKKPKETTKLDPKITIKAKGKSVKQALALVSESEIGASVLERALAASSQLDITLSATQTQTRHDYGGDRGGVDTINLNQDRVLVGGPGGAAQQLVMELTNLANKLRFWELDYRVQTDALDKEGYVEANERIEFEATSLVHRAWTAAQDSSAKAAWGRPNHKNQEVLSSWETWWAHMQRTNQSHLNQYRTGWDQLRRDDAPRIACPSTMTATSAPPEVESPSDDPLGLGYGAASDEES
jgi:hypothetical protein